MRRGITAAAAIFIAVFVLCARALAGTYTDDMDNIYRDQFREPVNMRYHYFAGAVPDYSTLTPAGKGSAYINYRVRNATDVTVYFYSRNGTLVKFDEARGKFHMGVYAYDMGLVQGQAPLPQAKLCPDSGEVYTLEGGLKWLVFNDSSGEYTFEPRPDHAPPRGEPLGYGLNIYHSEDGAVFTRAKAEVSYLYYDVNSGLVYETYKAKIPERARFIRVALNEMQKLRHTDFPEPQDYIVNSPLGATGFALAAFTVYGDYLIVGEPEKLVPEPPWEDYWYPPAASETTRTIIYEYEREREEESSSKAPALSESSVSEESPKPEPERQPASSKFTGVIAEESPSSWAGLERQPRVWLPEESAGPPGQPPPQTDSEALAAIDIAPPPQEDKGFTRGVTAYVVVASGGLAALVLFKPNK